MALCEARFKIYAFLEKIHTFEKWGVRSKIALSQGGGFFSKALEYENGPRNIS